MRAGGRSAADAVAPIRRRSLGSRLVGFLRSALHSTTQLFRQTAAPARSVDAERNGSGTRLETLAPSPDPGHRCRSVDRSQGSVPSTSHEHPDYHARVDHLIEEAVGLLLTAQRRSLNATEQRRLIAVVGSKKTDCSRQLPESLRSAVAGGKLVDEQIARARELLRKIEGETASPEDLDKAVDRCGNGEFEQELEKALKEPRNAGLDIEGKKKLGDGVRLRVRERIRNRLFEQRLDRRREDRLELAELERSIGQGVAGILNRELARDGVSSPTRKRDSGARIVWEALRERFLQRGTTLVEELVPRRRAILVSDAAYARRVDWQIERVLELLEKSANEPLDAGATAELARLPESGRHGVTEDSLAELRAAVALAKRVDRRTDRAAHLLEKARTGRLDSAETRELSSLLEWTMQGVLSAQAHLAEVLGKSREAASSHPGSNRLFELLMDRFAERAETLRELGRSECHSWRLDVARIRYGLAVPPSLSIDIRHFAQVARHPDPDRVVAVIDGTVCAVTAGELGDDHAANAVTVRFREAAKVHFGEPLREIAHLDNLEKSGDPLRVRDVNSILSANQAVPVQEPQPASPDRRSLHVLMVGGGPRSSTQLGAEIDLLRNSYVQNDIRDIRRAGGKYDIRTTIVERRGRDTVGMGNAWNRHQEGTVNTGAEGWGYGERLAQHYIAHEHSMRAEMTDFPPAQAIYRRAYAQAGPADGTKTDQRAGRASAVPVRDRIDGEQQQAPPKSPTVRTDRAAALRFQLGREEHEHVERLVRDARNDPLLREIYKLDIIEKAEVIRVEGSGPLRPNVSIRYVDGEEPDRIDADVVRMNTGTQAVAPRLNEGVEERTYVGEMSRAGLRVFLEQQGLLDDHGMLKSGTRVLTGGSGLSVYDQVQVLGAFMGLTRVNADNPLGYEVTETAKRKYPNAILITSNTPGKWISPRHSNTVRWTQNLEPISGAREQHALFLHNQGEEIYKAWEDICVATIAAAAGVTPGTVRHQRMVTEDAAGRTPAQARYEPMTTDELLTMQRQQTERHLRLKDNEEHTLYGAKRQAFLSTVLGLGLARDPDATAKQMSAEAPLTYKDRAGYMMHRAQLNGITEPGTEVARDSGKLFAVSQDRFQDVTASPAIIHALIPELIEAGIAKYTPGNYANIQLNDSGSGRPLSFADHNGNRTEHDFFLVSPVFSLNANAAEASLAGQVEPVVPDDPAKSNVPRVGQNRMIRRKDGAPLSVESYGLAGKGVRHGDSWVGIFAYDVNNRESAVQVAPGLAYRRMAVQHLATAGRVDPVGDVEKLYEKHYGDDREYAKEVERFRGAFRSAMEKASFLRIAERIAGEDLFEFKRLYQAAEQGGLDRMKELGGEAYARDLEQIRDFQPASRKRYFGRFVDAPEAVHELVYLQAAREAKEAFGEDPQDPVAFAV